MKTYNKKNFKLQLVPLIRTRGVKNMTSYYNYYLILTEVKRSGV